LTEPAEWTGRDDNQVSLLQQLLVLECLARLALQGTERMLDVGCRDGKFAAEIAARVPGGAALGVDRSRDMVAITSEHSRTAAQPNLRLRRMEIVLAARGRYSEEFEP
jgi:trans-aconitate 2-methyltransferase